MLCSDDVELRLQNAGLDHPYMDQRLANNRKLYLEVVNLLFSRGIISFGRHSRCEVGIFFVHKKDGTLRLICDTRLANCFFIDPLSTELVTGDTLGDVEITEWHKHLFTAQGDVKNAFYMLELPEELY